MPDPDAPRRASRTRFASGVQSPRSTGRCSPLGERCAKVALLLLAWLVYRVTKAASA
jgi:hypothetical protein